MIVDSVITLENDVNCLLLEKVTYNNDNYFLSVVLNEEEEPSDEYVVFKEINENGESFVEKVEEADLLAELVKEFSSNVAKLVENLPNEL